MKTSRFLLGALFCLGAALVYFAFRVLVLDTLGPSPSAWLALGVFYVDYLLLFSNFPLLFGRPRAFSIRIPLLAVAGWALPLYLVASAALAVVGLLLPLRFGYFAVAQGVLFFLFLAAGFLAALGSEKVQEVAASEDALLSRLRGVKRDLEALAASASRKPFCADLAGALSKEAEKLRYVSPVDSREAQELESSLAGHLGTLNRLLASCPDARSFEASRAEIDGVLDALRGDLGARKSLRN